jgi:arylsulfatase A
MPGRIPAGKVCHGLASTMDVLPTVATLCGATLPQRPLDGIDIWPLLSAGRPAIDRELLLYFDDIHLQCARLGSHKLHIARYNSAVYSPAPEGGRINLPLAHSELYDLRTDPEESYDIAPEKPEVVRQIQDRIGTLMAGFPENIRQAFRETHSKSVTGAVGAHPRVQD